MEYGSAVSAAAASKRFASMPTMRISELSMRSEAVPPNEIPERPMLWSRFPAEFRPPQGFALFSLGRCMVAAKTDRVPLKVNFAAMAVVRFHLCSLWISLGSTSRLAVGGLYRRHPAPLL